jgi:hypothetical protein
MSMGVGGASVVLVEFRHGGVETDAFKSRLGLVQAVIDNGAIGGSYHGSDEHLAALDAIEAHIRKVREFIADERAREESGTQGEQDG